MSTYNSTVPGRMVTADLEPVSVESKKEWFLSHDISRRPLWVIETQGSYAGWMSFSSFYGRTAYEGTVELSLYLDEDFRGKGLGKLLLEMAEEEARERNIHTLLGFIFGHNLASVRLFEGAGFEKWGSLPEVANMAGTFRDLLIYGKKTIPVASRTPG